MPVLIDDLMARARRETREQHQQLESILPIARENFTLAEYQFVLEKFTQHYIDESSRRLLEEVKKIVIARRHKPFQPATNAHRRFLADYKEKTAELSREYPFLDLKEELAYFSHISG